MLFRDEDEDGEVLPFEDRADAGRILASKLSAYSGRHDLVVVGLARGGAAVAFEVARSLRAPLDVLVVRKLGTPWNKELAMGAIAAGGVHMLDLTMVQDLCLSSENIHEVADAELAELQRREQHYRSNHPPVAVAGKTVILVDDGIAIGSSVLAAIAALRRQRAARVVVATPVIAVSSYDAVRMESDEVICVIESESFRAISQCYEDFREVSDEEVCWSLAQANGFVPVAA